MADSVDRSTQRVRLSLTRSDGQLTVGDLHLAATEALAQLRYEASHRLWLALAAAASAAGDETLNAKAVSEADRVLMHIRKEAEESSPTKYDYAVLSADRNAGMGVNEVAARWGCSIATVQKALEYVGIRNNLLSERPDLVSRLDAGFDPDELAEEFGVPAKVMRWVAANHGDRRKP